MSKVQHSAEFIQKRKLAMVLPIFVSLVSCFLFWIFDGGKRSETSPQTNTSFLKSINFNLLLDNVIGTGTPNVNKEGDIIEEQEKNLTLPTLTPSNSSAEKEKPEQENKQLEGISLSSKVSDPINSIDLKKDISSREEEKIDKEKKPSYEKEIKKDDDFDEELKKFYQKYENKDEAISSEKNKLRDNENPNYQLETKSDEQVLAEKKPLKIKPHFSKGIGSLVDHLPNSADYNERFYQAGRPSSEAVSSNMIKVVVHQNQTLSHGAKIKLRLLSNVNLGGRIIPKNTPLFGIISIDANRVGISISSIFYKEDIFPFAVEVYDRDGLPGLDVPGILAQGSREIAASMVDSIQMQNLQFQNVVSNANQNGLGVQFLQPNFEKQILYDGLRSAVEAIKNFIKAKLINREVYLKAGHILYLNQKSQK